jgi:eukaryotic-like serine/threonine-protein kinase
MPSCPSDETLAGLLADALTAGERDRLARHAEGCVPCQERLARLTATPITEMWRRAEHPPQGSEAEEGLVRRLKRLPRSSVVSEPPAVPGFAIVGELGRGGMGVVYHARQVALQRSVALKMVLNGAHAGPKELARFRAEAAVIARLQHPNIVQIYDVGEAAGRPYFALEFVAGGSLAQHLHGTPQPVRPAAQMVETLARAVHAAHANGVVHRDLKPANILLVPANQGSTIGPENTQNANARTAEHGVLNAIPKITDFGVAKCVAGDGEASGLRGATITGELLGTPNYMAPEQASGKNKAIGPAADVYALGVVLYELLTGRPPFRGETILDTLEQVRSRDPMPPSRLRPKLSRDLETICLKCLQKESGKRYVSASALADDLRRYLAGAPIQARPIRAWERGIKWARRKPAVAVLWAVGLAALLAGAGLGLGQFLEQVAWKRAAELALTEGEARQEAGPDPATWNGRYAAAQRAEVLVGRVKGAEELGRRVQQLLAELEAEERDRRMLDRLDEIRLEKAAELKDGRFNVARADPKYAEAFRWYGIDVEQLTPEEAAGRIRARPVGQRLAAALDDWAPARRKAQTVGAEGWRRLLEVARRADPDEWRNRVRDVLERPDRQVLLALAAQAERSLATLAEGTALPPTLQPLGEALIVAGETSRAVKLLRHAQQRYPGDFWLNQQLASLLLRAQPPEASEAVGYYRAALASRPNSPWVYSDLGNALAQQKNFDEAAAAYREAIRLKKDFPGAHNNLAITLAQQNKLDAAVVEFREAIRLDPDYPEAHNNLGRALYGKGELDAAIVEFRAAIRLKKDFSGFHNSLAIALQDKGELDAAIVEFREAIHLEKDYLKAHNNLGNALAQEAQPNTAADSRARISLQEDFLPHLYYKLGYVLEQQNKSDEAIAEFREAIRLKKDFAEAHYTLGVILESQGKFAEALAALRRGHELGSRQRDWRYPSAQMVHETERLLELEGRLPGLRKGEYQPRNNEERLGLAKVCQLKKLYLAAVRLYADAFAAKPALADDLEEGHRYNAACAAAQVAAGQGEDAAGLDDRRRAQWRKQALDWLRADLTLLARQLDDGTPQARAAVQGQLRHWQTDLDLAGLRDGAALAGLSGAERAACRQLWADVKALLGRASG